MSDSPNSDEPAQTLHEFLYENYGEMDCVVAIGADNLFVYVSRGKRHMGVIPEEWEGIPVVRRWTGKITPA